MDRYRVPSLRFVEQNNSSGIKFFIYQAHANGSPNTKEPAFFDESFYI